MMITKVICYERPDGGISIVYPVINIDEDPKVFTEEMVLDRAMKRCVPEELQKHARIFDKSELPQDRTFRNAWELAGNNIKVKMEKARELHKEKMNAVVKQKMLKLDEEYMRADEKDDKQEKKKIADKKQALRDVSKLSQIEAAQTPDELKAIWPEVLNG